MRHSHQLDFHPNMINLCRCGALIDFLHLLQSRVDNPNNCHLLKSSRKDDSFWLLLGEMRRMCRRKSAFVAAKWRENLDKIHYLYQMDGLTKSSICSGWTSGVLIREGDRIIMCSSSPKTPLWSSRVYIWSICFYYFNISYRNWCVCR